MLLVLCIVFALSTAVHAGGMCEWMPQEGAKPRLAMAVAEILTSWSPPVCGVEPVQFAVGLSGELASAALVPGEAFTSVGTGDDGYEEELSGSFVLRVNRLRGSVFVARFDEPEVVLPGSGPIAPTDVLVGAVESLAVLGIKEDEIGSVQVRTLRALVRSSAAGIVDDQPVAYKVVVSRQLGGVPVAGSWLVLSYDLQGTFYKMAGRWPPVAPAFMQKTSTPLTSAQACQIILAEVPGLPGILDSDGPVDARVVLVGTQTQAGHVLELAAEISYDLRGPGGRPGFRFASYIPY